MLWALSSTGRGVTRCQYLPGRSAMADPAQRRVTSCLLSRFAPGPSLAELQARERRFVLDCVAVERISRDYSGSLPKLGSVIPPYNSQRDPHVRAYFHSRPVPPLLQKTGQSHGGTSTYGELADRFQYKGAAALYLLTRNNAGAGTFSRQTSP
ncbi:hypothetical protein XENTR_v10015939 [Xenopus tropicalis]|nr:hypothetical protein XENTR_v10015939 [Xenopus tropicalis]